MGERKEFQVPPQEGYEPGTLCMGYLGVLNLQEGRFTLIQNKICGSTMSSLRDLNTSDVNSLGV